MTNSVEYDATAHDIRAVTVYQVNRAEVSRRIQVDLKVRSSVLLSHIAQSMWQTFSTRAS